MERIWAWYLPNSFSIASEISPKVALSLAASIAAANKFPSPELSGLDLAISVILFKAAVTFSEFRSALICFKRSIWLLLTLVLSISKISISSSSSIWYSFTPTIISLPASILACFLAAASSILSFGIPFSMALAIPPNSSTSSISFHAFSAILLVKDST